MFLLHLPDYDVASHRNAAFHKTLSFDRIHTQSDGTFASTHKLLYVTRHQRAKSTRQAILKPQKFGKPQTLRT